MKIRLYLEICSACNLKCQYCFEKEYTARFIDAETLFKFTDIVKPLINDIVITGGEPTLHTKFYEIVEHFSKYTNIVITTNGTMLSVDKISDMLLNHPNVRLQFSLDAINKKFVDQVRGHGVYERVIQTLSKLKDFNSQLSISSTLTAQTPGMLKEIYTFAKENNISCYFPSLLPYGALVTNWSSLMPKVEDYIQLEDTLFELIANDELDIMHSNKLDIMLGNALRYCEIEKEPMHIIKIDAFGHILSCPATDYSYVKSRIANIAEVYSVQELERLLRKEQGCISANLISKECDNCEIEYLCRRIFCGNCIHLETSNTTIVKYFCNTFKHHYTEIKEIVEEGANEQPSADRN